MPVRKVRCDHVIKGAEPHDFIYILLGKASHPPCLNAEGGGHPGMWTTERALCYLRHTP